MSNVGQSSNERVDLDGNDHAQLFHTGAANGDWVLTSLIVVSEDSQGDDFDVDICEAHNSTEFPTSSASTPCTRLSRPSSFAAGHLQFTAPGAGIGLNDNDNYVAVFKQSGNEDVSLDATTSAGEDSTGLSGWSIKNRFDWKDGNTWKHKGGGSNEAILITVNGYDTRVQQDATGRPVVLASAEGAPYLFADTSGIADGNGLPFTGSEDSVIEFTYSYQWIRVDGGTEANVGADSPRYRLVDADIGKQIKVEVSFTDVHNFSETVTSQQFGPVLRPASLPSPSTLVSNTGQSASATATITQQYAQEFTLGDHGQGYELSSVSIDLAAAPTDLTVSLWIGDHPVTSSAPRIKLFDFENPASFQVGLNRFTAPAGVLAYQSVRYYIVLTGFGSSLSIKETTSDDEDAGGEAGAELGNTARVRALSETGNWSATTNTTRGSVLRLAVEGSRRDGGILVSTFAQPTEGDQETISVGDDCCFRMGVGAADRYLIRGFSWRSDDSTPESGGITNPWDLVEGSSSSGARLFRLINTRNAPGITEWTAPQGATVVGGSSKTYTFTWDEDFPYGFSSGTRTGATLTQIHAPASGGGYDAPSAGVTVTDHGSIDTPYAPLLAILGEPLYALVQNLGQADNAYHSVGGASSKVVTQGFTTGSKEDGYGLLGIGVDIQGSAARVPDGPTFVSVAVHADSGGKPGAKLFDLVSPTEFAPGHSFFEAPRGTTLEPSTSYVMVWTYNGGTWHRLQRTTSNSEDTGKLTGSGIADAYYRGANVSSLSVDSGGHSLQIAVYTDDNATGRPVILSPVDEAGVLYAHTLDIADADGIPFSGATDTFNVFNKYTYRWIRVDGDAETNIGTDSSRYRLVDADTGKLIKVEVSFEDDADNAESVTSLPFGPITEPAPLPSPTTLVGNTGRSASATATAVITEEYAMGFRLGDHGQGYEISSVSIDLAAAPSDLTVSLWMGKHSGSGQGGSRVKLFDFENPASFRTRLNEFTAPAGAFAYHGVEYFITLSDFGASLSINETTSNNEDASGEPGAELANSAGGDTNVLRLAVKGSRRDSGILVSNFAQPGEGDQEISSLGDKCCFKMDVGNADRYLIRGFSWTVDDTTTRNGGWRNPFELHEGSSTGVKDGDDTRRLTMYNTRNNEGVAARTAPLGATVAGGSRTYTFLLDVDLGRDGEGNKIERIDAVLIRNIVPAADGEDSPGAAGFDLSTFGDAAYPDAPYATIFGEPLYAMTSNLGQSDNGYVSLGGANHKVVTQGFSTGPNEDGYDFLGIGVEIEGSDAQVPDGPTFVSVAVHADSSGKPGAKLFDLISPTEFAPGHSFFEAPRGTRLEANTSYVLVWRHNGGTWHRLQRTTSDGEDSGSLTRFWVSDSFYRGADLDNLSEDSDSHALQIAVYTNTPPPGNATGRPVILSPVDEAGVLYAHTLDIADEDGIPFSGESETFNVFNKYTYRWIRVDDGTETNIGADSPRYRLVDADTGKLIKVEVSFADHAGNAERVTSKLFGPITEPAPLPSPTTLVGNTGQPVSATVANITEEYAMGFTLGDHGQGYEIASVSIDLAAAPSDLTVSLWMGKHSGSGQGGSRVKLFDFENPASFQAGLNEFTAPAGAFAYHGVEYFITLSDFGASLSINETTSNNEDASGEPGAELANSAGGDTNVLRLAVKGSRRDSGILVSNFAQPGEGDQEISSLGDKCCFKMDVGNADRYLIRGFSWTADDTTTRNGGWRNPFELHEGSSTGVKDGDDTRRLTMYNTRNNEGVAARTAPLGATVAGGSRTYTFLLDVDLGRDGEGNKIERIDAVLIRNIVPAADGEDSPGAAGFDLSTFGDAAYPDAPYVTVFGEPLYAMVQNLGETDNSYAHADATNAVLSQGFTTGSHEAGYELLGIGVNIEGSSSKYPDGPTSVSVSVHADSSGQPGAKLFDLISPTEYAAGHSFFEAPPGKTLDSSTSYVLVWRHLGGTAHRLQRTLGDGEDSGALAGFSIANVFYRGADLDNLSANSTSNALEIAVYGVESDQPLVMPTASFERATYSVTESGSVTVKVQLSADPKRTVTIPLTTTNQGGATGADYSGVPASVTFQSGDTEKSFTFTAAEDTDDDDDESVKLGFGTLPTGVTAGTTSESTISIRDNDDPAVTVRFELANYSVAEGDTVAVKVQLSAAPERTVAIPLTTTNQSGATGADYSGVPASVTFQSGDTEKSFTFRAAQDTVNDDGESVKLSFGALPAGVTAGTRDEATVSIVDNDDPAVTVRFELASYTVAEGGSFTVKVQLNMNPERTVTIPLTRTHRGGASSSDYSGVPASVTFQSGDTEKSFTFTATQDTVDDDDESVRIGFSSLPAKVTAGTTRRATISITDDDDPAVTVRFELADYSVAEGDTVDVKVRLNVAPERTVTIPLTTTNEAGASSSDYSGVPSSVTFQSGDTERSFTFTAALDSVQDDAERVKLGFGALPARVTAGARDEATVLITDDDAPAITVGFEMADYPVAEGDNVAVRVKLNKNPERTVTIPLTTINQNGASSGDYSGVPSSVTFQSGQTVRSFTFTAALDSVEDGGESVKIGFGTLPAKVTSGATDEATVSITDVEPVVNQPPAVSATVEPNTVYPGDFVMLNGTATDPDGDALTFRWTSDGGGDFFPGTGLLNTSWLAPATETAYTVNLTMTATDTGGLSASVTLSVLVEPFPQPNAATDLEANVQEDNTIHLRWTIPSQPSGVTIASVEAQRRMSGGAFSPPSWDTVVTLPASATFTGVPGLAADTEYVFRVRLTTTHGLFADSRYIRVRTLTGAPAPRHFAASGPTQTSITLNWFTVETAAAYKLEYRKDGETEWNRISGDFDHLPSTTDHRDALGVAAGLDCNTRYDFRLSARGSGETRNDGNRYPSTHFGSYATTSAQTGECAQEERVTNLLVSVEPSCAILTWTPPSGDRDTGYRVERYSHTGRAVGELQRTPLETLVEEPNRVANRYEDCSAEYRTDGAEHFYSVTALDNNPGPDEEGAFGTAYTSMLRYGTSREPEGPLNVRLTHDTQSSRWLAWDAPRDPWLTTVKTARAGSGPQQVVTDPWTTGYRVERREYRRTEGGGWFLPEYEDEAIWSATMTVGSSTTGTGSTGYFGLGSNAYGVMTQTSFTHPVGSGSWEVTGLFVAAAELRLTIQEGAPLTDNLHTDAFEDWVLVVDGRSFPFELPEGVVGGNLQVSWPNHGLNWIDGQEVSLALVERLDWEALRNETDGDTDTSFTDSEDKGDKQYVYRVWAYNPRGLSLYSWRGDWVFNGGDPGGDPEPAVYIPPSPGLQQGGETPSNTPATGAPAIGGTPQVGETLTAGTAGIADEDGLTKVSYTYQWTAGGSDIDGATNSTYTLSDDDEGKAIRVRVSFIDDAGNQESLTSVATVAVASAPNREATGQPAISGTPQVGQTLTAGTSGIADEDGLENVSYSYQWIAGGSDIDGATGSSYTLTSSEQGQTVQVRVTFTDDAENAESLISEATETVVQAPSPLTVSLENAATSHNGTDVFTFEIRFSEQFGLSYKTLRDDAFTVVGGEVKKAQRMDRDSDTPNIWWRITVEPDGNGDVTITLPATTDCTDDGAICTEDGRKLSNRLEFTVSGPGG